MSVFTCLGMCIYANSIENKNIMLCRMLHLQPCGVCYRCLLGFSCVGIELIEVISMWPLPRTLWSMLALAAEAHGRVCHSIGGETAVVRWHIVSTSLNRWLLSRI